MRCVLVSCCGIPASGKTTFCRSIVDCAASDRPNDRPENGTCLKRPSTDAAITKMKREGRTCIMVSHVCFDEHIDLACRRRSARSRAPVAGEEGRGHGAVHIDGESRESEDREQAGSETAVNAAFSTGKLDGDTSVVEGRRSPAFENGEGSTGFWHEGRREAMAEVEALAAGTRVTKPSSAHVTKRTGVDIPAGHGAKANQAQGQEGDRRHASLHVVLADDNMHFRSMRHDVLCLARKYGCGYAQVYFPIEIEAAVRRNAARAGPVPEAVIRKMAASIQPPDPRRFKWERHTVVIEPPPTCHRRGEGVAWGGVLDAQVESSVSRTPRFDDDSGFHKAAAGEPMFWQTVAAAAENPVPSLLDASGPATTEQDEDRKATRVSALHQLDLELREAVRRVADKAGEASLTRQAFRAVMGAAAAARKTSLRRAREMEEDQRDPKGETDRIRNGRSKGSCDQGPPGGNCVGRPAPSARTPLEVFVNEFARGVEFLEGLGASTGATFVDAARDAGCLNEETG